MGLMPGGGGGAGLPGGDQSLSRAAFFSTQWSKPISTGLGGVAYTADPALAQGIERALAELQLPRPGLGQQTILAAQPVTRPLADQPLLHYPLVGTYRFLTQKLGLSVGSSTNAELDTVTMPPGYARRMGLRQRRGWQGGLAGLAPSHTEPPGPPRPTNRPRPHPGLVRPKDFNF